MQWKVHHVDVKHGNDGDGTHSKKIAKQVGCHIGFGDVDLLLIVQVGSQENLQVTLIEENNQVQLLGHFVDGFL